jgi:hypothetical protein
MRFLARHLVTFNFPKGVMYLKRVTSAPLKQVNARLELKAYASLFIGQFAPTSALYPPMIEKTLR